MDVASDKQAADILLMDLRTVCSFADYFVIGTVESERQMEAVSDEIVEATRAEGVRPHHVEGARGSGWLLMDYGDVVVHLFRPEDRERYGLETLWSAAAPLVRIQ